MFLYTTYTDYITQLKEFITDHSGFLTSLFAARVNGDSVNIGGGGEVPGELLPFEPDASFYYRIYNKGNNPIVTLNCGKLRKKECTAVSLTKVQEWR